MAAYQFGTADFVEIATGAAILASGGGGSYYDTIGIIKELSGQWTGTVTVQDYDGATNCCVIAMMGSPDAATTLSLTEMNNSIINTVMAYGNTFQDPMYPLGCLIPVETGPINSIVPLVAAALFESTVWVVDGDGAGRAVPELPQTTYGGSASLPVKPAILANDATPASSHVESAVLNTSTSSSTETLAGGIVSAFGSFSAIALWPSNASNGYALNNSYLPGTLSQAKQLGQYLIANPKSATAEVATQITSITGRTATPIVTNFYITAITQSTTSASLDTGVIRLDNNPDQTQSTATHYIYNLNENLIMYSSLSNTPDIIAPDSICYYSESTGLGFSNASNDLAVYFDSATGKSTGQTVSVIKVNAAPQLYQASGVVSSFAGLLRNIGYAGAMPYPET